MAEKKKTKKEISKDEEVLSLSENELQNTKINSENIEIEKNEITQEIEKETNLKTDNIIETINNIDVNVFKEEETIEESKKEPSILNDIKEKMEMLENEKNNFSNEIQKNPENANKIIENEIKKVTEIKNKIDEKIKTNKIKQNTTLWWNGMGYDM